MAKTEKHGEDPLKELRRQIQIGLDQAKRGELVDGEAAFEELLRKMADMAIKRKKQRSPLEQARQLVQAFNDELDDIAKHEEEARQLGDADRLEELRKNREHT